MSIIVRIISGADGSATPHDGRYVKAWNSNVDFGILALDSTSKKKEAKKFESAADALEEWRTQSKVMPLRPDHEPNRPLTALTVSFEQEE